MKSNPFKRLGKLFPALFPLSLLFFVLGCRPDQPRDSVPDTVSVDFWHAMGRRHSSVLNQIIAKFEAQNPDIRINSVYQGSYNSLLTNLTASCTAGTNPVMSQMYEVWTTRFHERGLLIPAEELFARYGGLTGKDREDIVSVFIEDNSWNGQLVTLPFNKSAYVLYYNKEALREIGMVNEDGQVRPPRTWEEFRKSSIQLTRKEKGDTTRYGFGIRPFIEGFTTFFFRAGGRYLDPSGKEVLFTGPEGQRTMNFLVNLVNRDKAAYVESSYLSTAFGSGRIAMFVGSTASMPYNARAVAGKFDWDTAPIPYPEGKKELARTLFQGTNIGIFKNHSSREQEAAWRFMLFLTNTDSSIDWAIGTGYLPIRYSSLESERMKEFLKKNPRYKTPMSLLDNGRFDPEIVLWETMRNVITDQFEAALNGRRGSEETLNLMKQKCEKIIESF